MINSADEFVSLVDSSEKSERDLAKFSNAPDSVWLDVIERYPEYRRWVAHCRTTPLHILAELCIFEPEVRLSVAMRRRLPPELFQLLSTDPDAAVRQQIAANAKTPEHVLRLLAEDIDDDVSRVARYHLARR